MVNSNVSPIGARKEERHDFTYFIEELKSRLDIIQVAELHGINVNKQGQADCFNGHDEKTPSLSFFEDTQSYHCFACGSHGDVISLVQHVEGWSFIQAVNSLAIETGMKTYQSNNGFDPEVYGRVSDCLRVTAEIYHSWLLPDDPYLAQRGISYGTAQKFMIGHARGKDDLRLELEQRGFAADTMVFSGLIKMDGTDFFQDHIVVPVISSGRVTNFYGRSLNENAGQRHRRLPNDRLKMGEGFFNLGCRSKEIILVEGVFDALALIDKGFPNAVATLGTQGLNGSLPLLGKRKIKKAFVCYDGDPAGSSAALGTAYDLEGLSIDARVVDMPAGEDPNSFLKDHTQEDFLQLLDSSLSPFDLEIRQIGAVEVREEQLKMIKDRLLPRVKQADPIMQPELIKKIHDQLDIPLRALNEQLKRMRTEGEAQAAQQEVIEVGSLRIVNPALDLIDGAMIIMAPIRVLDAETQVPRWQNTVVSSTRERFTLSNEELLKRGWYAPALERTDIRVAEERYSTEAINGFLEGSLSGSVKETFSEIRRIIQHYIDFSDDRTYDFLTCWIIGTYFYPIFSHYPYVHFTGPKGSGKSQCLHVLRCLCHNAKIAGSMTLAVQFRIIGALQPTLLFDEMENLGQTQHTELHRMLKYGFEKNGPQVWRMDMSGNRMDINCWGVYCPRAFASIEGMEEVIASRSVQVIMERSFDEEIKNRTVNSDDDLWQELRDKLFLVTMADGPSLKGIYDQMNKPTQIYFSGRDWDIFKGVLSVAELVGNDVFAGVVSFAVDTHETKIARDNDNSPDMIILKYLSETVTQNSWYELGQLNDDLTHMASSQGLDLQGRMTRDRLGKRLAALRVAEDTKRAKQSGKKVTLYRMDPGIIAKKLENHLRG